jgi:hypothetical protein
MKFVCFLQMAYKKLLQTQNIFDNPIMQSRDTERILSNSTEVCIQGDLRRVALLPHYLSNV